MAPQHEPKVRLQARGNVPNKTTTIILASALTVGIIMLILGCYFIYQLYMNRIGRRQQRTRSHRRSNARNQAAAHAAPALELRDIIPSHDATRTGTRNSGQRNETTTTYRDIWPDTIPGPSRNSNRMSSQLSQGHGNVRMNGNRGSKRTSRTSGPGAQRHFSPDYPDEDYMRVRSAVRFSGPTPLPAMPPQSPIAPFAEADPIGSPERRDIEMPGSSSTATLPHLPSNVSDQGTITSTSFSAPAETATDRSELIGSLEDVTLHAS